MKAIGYQHCLPVEDPQSLIELTIPAREADIGGLHVKRLLPWAKRRMLGLARKVETEMNESWYEDFYHHLRMEMDEYRRLKRNLRVLKSYTDYEEDLYEEAV